MIKKNLGGDRLGSGNKMEVALHNYERSTHDLGYIWRSTMASGTLVPFMNMVALPGDTFDIDLNADVKTYPTAGPLFGSYKLQLDVFTCPIRLYQGVLHNNKLGIGLKMSEIKLPQLDVISGNPNIYSEYIDMEQINPSSLLAYLGIRGVGRDTEENECNRMFNALPYLSYWDIYKNYYANKQEEVGAFIDTSKDSTETFRNAYVSVGGDGQSIILPPNGYLQEDAVFEFWFSDIVSVNPKDFKLVDTYNNSIGSLFEVFEDITVNNLSGNVYFTCSRVKSQFLNIEFTKVYYADVISEVPMNVALFPLENLDKMREDILAHTKNSNVFLIGQSSIAPYGNSLKRFSNNKSRSYYSQQGLALKTYQSDIFNNWLNKEWIEGNNGINDITAVSTVGDEFTLDALNLANKVYNMLNRIAVSGGSYDDWMQAVYGTEPWTRTETPVYHGGLSKEIVFQEVVNTAESKDNPLGGLGGRGTLGQKHKGGSMYIKVNEPSILMGIVSITPRVDYSQGNDWTVNLKTMDDFHKPALDEIGFQDLMTEQMAWWDWLKTEDGVELKSAGKQPAWLNYMTNFNKTYGNFADPRKEMFMTLNRRYENLAGSIKDLTTYIDPTKFNYAFAQTTIDSQNFWVQLACGVTARRKMSAKLMPNL